jgi:hypothetical protein
VPTSSRSLSNSTRNFARRPFRDKLHLLKALPFVIASRVGLTVLGYRRLLTLIDRPHDWPAAPSQDALAAVRLTSWAVQTAARFVPAATCLTQAVAASWMLARAGERSTLHIGVRSDPGKTLEAHAWLISQNVLITGGPPAKVAQYTPLTTIDC